ncbi:MAG TPA: zinc-dependent metalloprotease [Gemmatimonadaceae bacterium]|nr:zinc-dependent metalloprotease [Gemmatimonadaceae bacterium]
MSRRLLCALTISALGCAPVTAQNPAPAPAPSGAQQAQGAQGPRTTYKKFEELTKDATYRPGFFETYEKEGRVYLAIPKQRLGEQFLLTYEIAQGMGSRNVIGGTMLNIFEASAVSIERRGDKVFLLEHPVRYTAQPGSPTEKAVALTFAPSVLDAAKIESFRGDSAVVFDMTDWMLSDLSDIGSRMRAAVTPRPGTPGRATLDKNRSYIESVKGFPENLNVRAKLTFAPGEPIFIQSVTDSRFIPVSIHYSFVKLPAEPMKPRLADDRLGYYMTVHKDFSSLDDSFFRRYVHKWRLEPGEKVGDLYKPKKPIVYYIDRTVPEEYRPYVMAGVTAWNRAFEAAGFKDAIRAEILPDSVDAEDIRYATIRWNTSDIPDYGAIGPSMVDPRTGEVLDADILVEASMIQNFRRSWKTVASPSMAAEAVIGTGLETLAGVNAGLEHATMAPTIAAQGALLRALLVADGTIEPNEAVPSEMVGQAILWVTAHEVGHTLGLRHNFRSSTDTPLDKLYDREFLTENGIYSSVMEYPSINVAPKGTKNGIFYNTGVGTYDRWVIGYGYHYDDAHAAKLAREAAKAGHAYGTDEDAYSPGAVDPTTSIWDLSSDPLTWGKQRAALIASLFPTLPERVLTDNSRYADLTDAFQTLYGQYVQAVATSVKHLGGQMLYRDHAGDPEGRPPFVPVPRARQLEALAFLTTSGFGEKSFPVPREVVAKFGTSRWAHWGETMTFNGRNDYPWHEQVLNTQRTLLNAATQPLVFARIRDAELKFGAKNVVTIPELMNGLTSSIWSEVWTGAARNVSSNRRDLQRAYLDRMTEIVVGNPERLPADARSVGRAQLAELKRRVDLRRLAAGSLDAYTRAHFTESSARIAKILEAGLTESVPRTPPPQQDE